MCLKVWIQAFFKTKQKIVNVICTLLLLLNRFSCKVGIIEDIEDYTQYTERRITLAYYLMLFFILY